jgi:hypothetical protein
VGFSKYFPYLVFLVIKGFELRCAIIPSIDNDTRGVSMRNISNSEFILRRIFLVIVAEMVVFGVTALAVAAVKVNIIQLSEVGVAHVQGFFAGMGVVWMILILFFGLMYPQRASEISVPS